ncbi:hypothetical protein Droror1_Dr00006801 [Drosera rotundifolia]
MHVLCVLLQLLIAMQYSTLNQINSLFALSFFPPLIASTQRFPPSLLLCSFPLQALHLTFHSSLQAIMRPPSSLKEEFLKKWVSSLQTWRSSSKEMSLVERKEAIRLSADLAMASTRNGATMWSRALMANACKDSDRPGLVGFEPMATIAQHESLKLRSSSKSITPSSRRGSKQVRRKKISMRNGRKIISKCHIRRSRKCVASVVTERLVKKRTQVLKELVPGGEYMDESDLLKETLDYIFSLRAQVHVMQSLANATHLSSSEK